MKFIDKIIMKQNDNKGAEGVTIAFLGDSVTQGCFEIFKNADGEIETVFDKMNSYEMTLYKILAILYPTVPVNIINAGISGDSSAGGLKRLNRDVIRHQPDLCVVAFALNDCSAGSSGTEKYAENLRNIFSQLHNANIETVFLTPNMMNTKISVHNNIFPKIAEDTKSRQLNGILDIYVDKAREVCRSFGVPVCDCYLIWKQLSNCGIDTTELLSNKINHPSKEMYKMFGYELVRTILFSHIADKNM